MYIIMAICSYMYMYIRVVDLFKDVGRKQEVCSMLLLWDIEALHLNRLNSLSCWMGKVPIDVCIMYHNIIIIHIHTYVYLQSAWCLPKPWFCLFDLLPYSSIHRCVYRAHTFHISMAFLAKLARLSSVNAGPSQVSPYLHPNSVRYIHVHLMQVDIYI